MSTSAAATVVSAAQKAQNFANQTVETARFEVLKEPLGFIKILQFFMALLAFAIAVNGSSSVGIYINCSYPATTTTTTTTGPPNSTTTTSGPTTVFLPGSALYIAEYSYPYNLEKAKFTTKDKCAYSRKPDRETITNDNMNVPASAGFFVFTGVTAFLYSFAFAIIYVFFRHKYNNIVFLPLIDFGATCLYTLFWFAGSIAWAKAVNDIQNLSDPERIIGSLKETCNANQQNNCFVGYYPSYSNIIVSCVLGFGNLILWAGNVWFVLKETTWYKTRKELQQQERNVTNNPISTNDINITAHYNPNNRI